MRYAAVSLAIIAGIIAGCSSDSAGITSNSCDEIVTEPLDANSTHLLPGAATPTYLTDPPTSGPHLASRPSTGVQAEPLDPMQQVSTLEVDIVLFQHTGLDPDEVAVLEGLAGRTTAVAPNPDIDSSVIATAWGLSMRCSGVDPDALTSFTASANAAALDRANPAATEDALSTNEE